MSQYKLKPNMPDFEVVDGPLAGRKFLAGQVYPEVPESEKNRFEVIPDQEEKPTSKVQGLKSNIKEEKTDA